MTPVKVWRVFRDPVLGAGLLQASCLLGVAGLLSQVVAPVHAPISVCRSGHANAADISCAAAPVPGQPGCGPLCMVACSLLWVSFFFDASLLTGGVVTSLHPGCGASAWVSGELQLSCSSCPQAPLCLSLPSPYACDPASGDHTLPSPAPLEACVFQAPLLLTSDRTGSAWFTDLTSM